MNHRKIEDLIPRAMESIKNEKELFIGDKVKRVYKGYIDGMGPSMILAGMRQTICFYSEEKEKANRQIIIQLLGSLLKIENLTDHAMHITTGSQEYRKLRESLMEGIVALKLALKTFPISDREEGEQYGD